MASFKISHRILFNLEFELNGYRDDVAQYIKVLPDQKTNELFSKYRIMFRKYKNSYLALIEVEPEPPDFGKPRIEIKQNEVFKFQIKISDIVFFARTHLYAYDFRGSILMLSNEANHVDGTTLLLSKSIGAYSAGNAYKSGYLAQSGSSYYSAILPSNSADAHPVTDSLYWKNIPNGGFVSQADLQLRPSTADLNTFMVVDIKHSNTLPPAYQLLDAAGECREVSYKIKLLTK
jgi:hypothetical protein